MIWKARGGIERIHEEKLCYKKRTEKEQRVFCLYFATAYSCSGDDRAEGVKTRTPMFYLYDCNSRRTAINRSGENILFVYRIATHAEMQEVKILFILSLFNNNHS